VFTLERARTALRAASAGGIKFACGGGAGSNGEAAGLAPAVLHGSDLFSLSNIPGEGNDLPLTTPTKQGKQYIFTATPKDSGSGLYKLWWTDGQTGELHRVEFDKSSNLYGPNKAADRVQQRPEVSRLNDARVLEVIPQAYNDTLYWQVHVVPESNSGITYYGLVNAETGDVTLKERSDQVYRYLTEEGREKLRDENVTESQEDEITLVTIPSASSDDTTRFVVVRNETTGEVEKRIELDEEDTVLINETRTTTNTTAPSGG